MTPLLPGLWFLLLAVAIGWLVRRLDDDLPRRVVLGALALCVLLLAPALLRGYVLSSPRLDAVPPFGTDPRAAVAAVETDPAVRALPFERLVLRSLLRGEAPLWNPLHGAGTPLLAAPEAQVGQPFVVAAWPFPPGPGLAVTAALQLYVALLFGWLVFRRYAPFTAPPGDLAAFAGATVYALLAVLPVHGWPQAHVAALFPALLYALLRLTGEHEGRHGRSLHRLFDRLFAVAVAAALILAGAPRTAAVAVAAALVLTVAHLARRPAARRSRPAGRALVALLLAAALAAPVLLPTLHWLPHTEAGADAATERFRQTRLDPLGLKALRLHEAGVPRWGGGRLPWRPLAHGSVLLLAALALCRPATWRRPGHPTVTTAAPLVLGAVSLALVLAPAPLLGVLRYLHLAPDPAGGSPAFFAVAFVLALLATAGLRGVAAPPARRPGAVATLAAGALAVGALLSLPADGGELPVARAMSCAVAAVVLTGACAALPLSRLPRSAGRLPGLLLPLLVVLPLGEAVAASLPLPLISPAGFYRPSPAVDALAAGSGAASGNAATFRTAAIGPSLPPGMTVLYGLPDARAVPGQRPWVYAELLRPLEGNPGFLDADRASGHPLLDLLGVRTLLASDGTPVTRRGALPLFHLPTAAVPFTGGDWRQAVREVEDFRSGAVVQRREPADRRWRATAPGDNTLRMEAAAAHRWVLHLTLAEERLLASSLYQDGGWRLSVDGRDHPTLLANGPFVAAWVPAGEHRVEVVYRPPGLAAGLWLALFGAGGLVWFVAAGRRGGREG